MIAGGARSNHFRVDITFPTFVSLGNDASDMGTFLCKGASLPATPITNVAVKYRGQTLNLAGTGREFQTWRTTIYNDGSMKMRTAFEQWQNGIQNTDNSTGISEPNLYKVNLIVCRRLMHGLG